MSEETMDEKYGDGSDHKVCPVCGWCIDCGDCLMYGCKDNKDSDDGISE